MAETRLLVSDNCIDCGDCVPACPVGALQLGPRGPTDGLPLGRAYDVVVIGAGPGGSTAARVAAEAGLSVLLLEKRQEIGSPVRCAEGVGHDGLVSFIQPDTLWISACLKRAEITTVVDDKSRTYGAEGGRGYVLERCVFDRFLAEWAVRAGATVRVKTAATGVLMEGDSVCGVSIQGANCPQGGRGEVVSRVVIAADGVESQLGRWAGLDVQLPLRETLVCAQYLLAGIQADPTCACYFIGHDLAPGGYAWIFPKGEGKANVGLGVQAGMQRAGGADPGTALAYLTRFIEARSYLAQGSPVALVTGNVPGALPPARLVTDGLMLVGDAARQADPLTGGGIINAMVAGKLAAQAAIRAIEADDPSADALRQYEKAWQQGTGRKMARNHHLRERFPPGRRTDQRFVRAFALAVSG